MIRCSSPSKASRITAHILSCGELRRGGVRVSGCEEKGGGGQWKEGRKGGGSSGGVVSKIRKKNDMMRRRLFFSQYRNTSFVPERSVCDMSECRHPYSMCVVTCACVGEPCLRCHP